MGCAEQSRLGTDGSSFICGNGALGVEGRSRGVYSAGRICRTVHAALLSAFICFPLLMKGKSRMPLAIMAMGILFNVINATLLAASFFSCALPGKYEPATFWTNPLSWAGLVIFLIGMAINLHADHVIRNLRKPGDTRHYLPEKGFYRYVTSANYFGELVEWTGFALLTASPAAWVFVWWTAANLVPRADAIYKRYCEEFGKQAVGNRKRIIPCIY